MKFLVGLSLVGLVGFLSSSSAQAATQWVDLLNGQHTGQQATCIETGLFNKTNRNPSIEMSLKRTPSGELTGELDLGIATHKYQMRLDEVSGQFALRLTPIDAENDVEEIKLKSEDRALLLSFETLPASPDQLSVEFTREIGAPEVKFNFTLSRKNAGYRLSCTSTLTPNL